MSNLLMTSSRTLQRSPVMLGTATVSEGKKGQIQKDEEEAEVDNKKGLNQNQQDQTSSNLKKTDDENPFLDENEVCEDKISNIAGSLSCKNFLRSFAYQYCRHKYIRKNCCASHKIYCRRGRRARQKHNNSKLQQVPSTEVVSTKTY